MLVSLSLGLLAALLWGIHDYVVRLVGGRADPLALLLMAMATGAVLLTLPALMANDWNHFTSVELGYAALSGLFYALGTYVLYRAFTIGPVRLVAPICGAYPLLSVLFQMARGQEAGLGVWAGVLAVVAGISLVTRGDAEEATGRRVEAILWSLLAAIGFAITFGFSQWAAETAPEMPVIWVARLFALATVALLVLVRQVPLKPAFSIGLAVALMGTLDSISIALVTLAGGWPHPEYAAVTASMFGIVTVLLAWRFLGETMRVVQWIGILAAFGGIAILTFA